MKRWRSQLYLREGNRRGISPDILSAARATADALASISPNLPPLFTLKHLAVEVGVPYSFLRSVVTRAQHEDHYRVFKLKKTTVGHAAGRVRYICVPHPLLLRAQRWIHSNILSHVQCHNASVAYHPGSNIRDIARQHCGCRWMIKLDVTNFFESILEPDVYRAFRRIGYQPLIAFELARLCTRLRRSGNPNRYQNNLERKSFKIVPYTNHLLGHLPQGAPTSPLVSNIVALELDKALSAVAERAHLTYTRYADDMTFSTMSHKFTREQAVQVVDDVQQVLRQHGFWPNKAKTRIVSPRARKVVLGLLVDGSEPRLAKEFKERLRVHLHCLTHPEIGPVKHAMHRGFDSVLGLQHHVFGLAAFAAGIEPKWGKHCQKALRTVAWPTASSYSL